MKKWYFGASLCSTCWLDDDDEVRQCEQNLGEQGKWGGPHRSSCLGADQGQAGFKSDPGFLFSLTQE